MGDLKVNRDLIRSKILHSKELTALEKRYIESLIDAKPERAGRWIPFPDKWGWYCSECKFAEKSKILSVYCRCCGARMDEEEERNG